MILPNYELRNDLLTLFGTKLFQHQEHGPIYCFILFLGRRRIPSGYYISKLDMAFTSLLSRYYWYMYSSSHIS